MKVKELIEKLQKFDQDKDVIIRFALSNEDDIGYILRPGLVDTYIDSEVAIYSIYDTTKEDCDFIGQIELKELWEKEYNKNM